MKDNFNHSLPTGNIQNARFVNRVVVFVMFLFTMLFFSEGVVGQNPALTRPNFNYLISRDRGNSSIGTEANINVAVDTDSEGNVYILTFGNGVFKYDPKTDIFTKIITDQLGESGSLNSPLDLAIDNNDIIYIADGGSKLIKKYSTSGIFINSIGSGSVGNGKDEFWEPTGIEFDNSNNLYIVDAYRGTNKQITQKFFLKIYYTDGRFKSFQGTSDHPIINPYRVAANDKYIFISHSSNNGEVLVFNQDFSFEKTLSDIGSPGSLFIDDFGYLYAVDYANRLNFGQIFKIIKGDAKFGEYFSIYNQIEQGINESEFRVQIFNTNLNKVTDISEPKNASRENDIIQLPLDLTLDHCGKLFLIDANISSLATLNFDLEIYQRTPSFDSAAPPIVCQDDIEVTANEGENFAVVNFQNATTTEGDVTITQTKGLSSDNQFPVGDSTIEFTATDLCGNKATCSFIITVLAADSTTDTLPPVITCPADISKNNDPGKCAAMVTFQPPTVTDNSGEPITPVRTDNIALKSGDLFPVGTTTLIFSATDSAGNSATCELKITITDTENPSIDCPVNIIENVNFGATGKVVTYNLPTYSDNCSATITLKNGLVSGAEFPIGTTTNTFEVKDAAGLTTECSFTVTIYQSEDSEPPVITCSAPINKNNDAGKCGAIVNFEPPTVTDNSGEPITPVRTDNIALNSGDLFPVGTTTLIYSATDSAGNSATCELKITITDTENPSIDCPANIIENVNFGVSGKVVTYDFPTYSDNCSATITRKNGLVSGSEFPIGTTTNTFLVTDAAGLTAECSFTVTITQDAATPTFECPDPNVVTILPLDENCDYDEPDYSNKITNPKYFIEEAFFIQTSSRTDNTLNIQIEVYDGQGGEYIGKCEFPVTLQDQIPADVKCLEDKLIPYTDSKSFRLKDYREQLTISDNCSLNFEIVQTPAPGTIITDNTTVNFSVTDENNNQSGCSFKIKFFKDSDLQILNCPGDQFFQVDENCSYAIPELASTINTNIEGATVTQDITAGFEVNGNLTLTITAKFEDQVDTCEVKLITTDAIFPTIECPADQTEMVQQGEGFQLPNYILNAVYADNCFIQELKQQPDVGTVIYETTEIILTVVDNYGNSTDCTFSVNIITENPDIQITCLEDQTGNLDANCQFQLPDYTQQAQANFDAVITQSPLPGSLISSDTKITLTATGDTGQTSCSFNINVVDTTPPVVNCVGIINLRLDAGGTASLSPQDLDDTSFDACGSISRTLSKSDFSVADLGTNTVRLTVTDASGNSGFCDTTVNVLPYEENAIDFTCKESFILQLDNNGEAQLSSRDLYTGSAGNYQFSVDKTSFTCADKGSNTVTLYYSDGNTGGNCRVEVVVEDLLPPVVRTKDISITLDANGTASITPEMLDNGSIDNCGDIRLFLDKTDFTCNNLGENRVILRAQDGSSNSASATATVTVLGNCQEPPITPTGPGYIFIYPNPTVGPFSYFLPAGIVLEKVEVYDMQGKYITTTLFEEGTVQYKMDLSYLQSAVYVLKLYTNKEELILRVIVR